MREIFVLVLICNFDIIGIGNVANTKSVKIFTAGYALVSCNSLSGGVSSVPPLNKPIFVNVSVE